MTCRACGHDHKPTVRCEVAARLRGDAINTPHAINKVRLTDAINTSAKVAAQIEVKKDVPALGVEGSTSELGRSPNRRDRKAYNAYMREYMKKRRAA